MGVKAVRVGDFHSHGGAIVRGASQVIIEGSAAARKNDEQVCPMMLPGTPPHIGGFIVGPGSPNVFIEKEPACCQYDLIFCLGQMFPGGVMLQGASQVFYEPGSLADLADLFIPHPIMLSPPWARPFVDGGEEAGPYVKLTIAFNSNIASYVEVAAAVVGAVVAVVALVLVAQTASGQPQGIWPGAMFTPGPAEDLNLDEEGLDSYAAMYFL